MKPKKSKPAETKRVCPWCKKTVRKDQKRVVLAYPAGTGWTPKSLHAECAEEIGRVELN